MNSTPCPQDLELFVLDALTPEESAARVRHVQECAACREEVAQLRRLTGALQAAAEGTTVPPPLRHRLQRELWLARARERLWTRRPVWMRAAALLVAVLGVGAGGLAGRNAWREAAGGLWVQSGFCTHAAAGGCYPVVSGDTVTAVEMKGGRQVLLGMDRHTGRHLWETPFAVSGGLSADARRVYVWRVEDADHYSMVALDSVSGRELWSAAGRMATCRRPWPTIAACQGVAWSDDSQVVLLDGATGITRWTRTVAGEGALSRPVTDAVNLYVASGRRVQALDPVDGHVLWTCDDQPASLPAVPPLLQCDGNTLVVVRSGRLGRGVATCRDAATGDLRWNRETEMPWNLAVGEGHVFLRGAHIRALDGRTGEERWSVAMGGCSPIEVAGGCVYTVEGIDRRGVFALRADTGQQVWAQRTISSCSGFSVAGRTGYLSSQDGTLRAVVIRPRGS